MQIKYRRIENGRVIGEQTKDMDGDMEMNAHRIHNDLYGGTYDAEGIAAMDPLKQARAGGPVLWVEAREVRA